MSIGTALGELSLAKHHFFLNTGLFDQSNSIDIKYLAEAFLIGLYDILRHTHTKISTMKKKSLYRVWKRFYLCKLQVPKGKCKWDATNTREHSHEGPKWLVLANSDIGIFIIDWNMILHHILAYWLEKKRKKSWQTESYQKRESRNNFRP